MKEAGSCLWVSEEVGLIISIYTGEDELHQVCNIDAEGTVGGVLEGGLVTLEDSSEDKKPERLTHWRGKRVAASFQASAGHSCAGEDRMGQVRKESVCVKGRQTDDLEKFAYNQSEGNLA
jgi:hypothetical protein